MIIAICDSDEASRERLTRIIGRLEARRNEAVTLHTFESGEQLLFALDDPVDPPDIVILDAELPGVSGVELGKELRAKGHAGIIVFVTQSDQYVFDAFDLGAFNYVIKDLSSAKSEAAAMQRLESVLFSAMDAADRRHRKYLLLNGISEHRSVPIDSISHFEVRKHIVIACFGNGEEFEFVSTLQHIEDVLLSQGFVRIHRSFVVNSAFVERYTYKHCVMRNGKELPVGRQYYKVLKTAMEGIASASAGKSGEGE